MNFSLYSRHASRIELCLFESREATSEAVEIPLTARTGDIWHVFVPGVKAGDLYGYRVHGAYDPAAGHRFNPNKILLDPYARAIGRPLRWSDAMFGYQIGAPQADLSFDETDNAAWAPLAAVVDPRFAWGSDRHPRVPWQQTVIYEAHVRGLTQLHPRIPADARGTYQALGSRAMISHLRQLGVTTLELLPVQYHLDERHLVQQGLRNYWGYSPLGFFAPHPRHAVGQSPQAAVNEFKTMVKRLHAAGIEVILDVVYNHTGEGQQLGPTISFRGLDNRQYYRLSRRDPRYYWDASGCGNCLEVRHPVVIQLIADSLRYWVTEMHVDGFRFDLAPVLGREHHHYNPAAVFFQVVHQDPVLSQVKLIAEPWDLGEHGYQLGNFLPPWREWNGKYRDTIRDFWRGEGAAKGQFAARIAGSTDLFPSPRRGMWSGVNFVTCHDGFSLRDLVSYNQKHNEANGEENRDGDDHNRSWNCGVEGSTSDPAILLLRQRQQRNLLATLLLSAGVPMLRGGDEISLTQNGNNNAYCQDNEISWLHWPESPEGHELQAWVARLLRFRQQLIRRGLMFTDAHMLWLRADGQPLADGDWHDGAPEVGVLLRPVAERKAASVTTAGAVFLAINAGHVPRVFQLPARDAEPPWRLVLDTAHPELRRKRLRGDEQREYVVAPRALCAFASGWGLGWRPAR